MCKASSSVSMAEDSIPSKNGLFSLPVISIPSSTEEIELLVSKVIKIASENPTLRKIKPKNLPAIAVPTVILFVVCWALFLFGFWLAVFSSQSHRLSVQLAAFTIQLIGNFFLFTVAHDAAHGAISSLPIINEVLGRIVAILFFPCTFGAWKMMHHQHHKFTNDVRYDPDYWVCHGKHPSLLVRVLCQPFYYGYFYVFRMSNRSLLERSEFFFHLLCSIIVVPFLCYQQGVLYECVVHGFLPGVIVSSLLSYLFDVVPHQDCAETPQKNCFKTTNQLVSKSMWVPNWLLTLVMQFQTYHHIHHLHPSVPFYRYIPKHNSKKELLKAKGVPVLELFSSSSSSSSPEKHEDSQQQ